MPGFRNAKTVGHELRLSTEGYKPETIGVSLADDGQITVFAVCPGQFDKRPQADLAVVGQVKGYVSAVSEKPRIANVFRDGLGAGVTLTGVKAAPLGAKLLPEFIAGC